MDQMQRLSSMEELTLQSYKGELERGLNSWGAKLSFTQTKEMEMAKEVVLVVSCMIDELGEDAKADDLIHMDRLSRMRVATASNKTLEEIAIMVTQVQNMDLMHKTLKKRKEEGKPIPPDGQAMQAAVQKEALSIMSKAQKDMIKGRQMNRAQRMARRNRKR